MLPSYQLWQREFHNTKVEDKFLLIINCRIFSLVPNDYSICNNFNYILRPFHYCGGSSQRDASDLTTRVHTLSL